MELIVDFSFQKWPQQRLLRTLLLCERPICVFYVHHLFVCVTQAIRSRREMSGQQLTVGAKAE